MPACTSQKLTGVERLYNKARKGLNTFYVKSFPSQNEELVGTFKIPREFPSSDTQLTYEVQRVSWHFVSSEDKD